MFSYVAKSLLSKTLQTFLRNYLENIELESISYGSSASSSTSTAASDGGSGSGWGVRLSNVKLREGMELLKLPGKRKRTVVVKKKVKRRKQKRAGKKKKRSSGENDKPSQSTSNGVDTSNKPLHSEQNTTEAVTIATEALPLKQQTVNRERSVTAESDFGYFSSNPSTPTQTRTTLCGAPSSFCLNSNSKRAPKLEQPVDMSRIPVPPFDVTNEQQKDLTVVGTKRRDLQQNNFSFNDSAIEIAPAPSVRNKTVQDELSVSDDDDSDGEDSVIEVEEEQNIEEAMSLVVGAGGIIGTLNIRLVGRELHVTVEDAHLIIEALPEEPIDDGDDKTELETDSSDLTTPSKEPSYRSSYDASEASLPKAVKEHATTGEKIKEKSEFARYLSMIPHLFLRDCRVSIILPGGTDDVADDDATNYSCGDCTVFEFGVGFLSVTSGDELIDVLQFDTGNKDPEKQPARKPATSPTGQSGSTKDGSSNNIFARKRIRTGKGAEGGVWLKILPPNSSDSFYRKGRRWHGDEEGPKWSRRRFFDSTEMYFFRCSGLDLHARMLVDVKKDSDDENAGSWSRSSEYDDCTMDSMLFGVDYVDPISLTRHQIKEKMKRERISNNAEGEVTKAPTDTDFNGIQHVPFASNFHWIAQYTHQMDCTNTHLPLSECIYCLNARVNHQITGSASKMFTVMPLPGFVFCLSVSDPLEVNVNRSSLDAFGCVIDLFTSKNTSKQKSSDDKERPPRKEANSVKTSQDVSASSLGNVGVSSFPTFMQPDTIYLSGVYISKLVVRVHAMRPSPQKDDGFQFRYWQLIAETMCVEEQQLDSDEQFFRDLTFHAGDVSLCDYVGVEKKHLVVAGSNDVDESVSGVHVRGHSLPFTASRILDVAPPMVLKTSYALHARMIRSSQDNTGGINFVNLKVGMVDVDVDSSLSGDLSIAYSEAMRTLFKDSKKKSTENPKTTKSTDENGDTNRDDTDSKAPWLLQVAVKGGNLSYRPKIQMSIPTNAVFIARSDINGFSVETLLNNLGVKYGSYLLEQPLPPSILHLCSLPESLRMHVLLYLDDLSSLEQVLGIKKKKASPFLRIHSISKKLTKLEARSKINNTHKVSGIRRDDLLKQLQLLDNDALGALLAVHNSRSQVVKQT